MLHSRTYIVRFCASLLRCAGHTFSLLLPRASVCVAKASRTSDCRDSSVQTSSRKGKQRVEGQSAGSAGEEQAARYQRGQPSPPQRTDSSISQEAAETRGLG